MIYELAIFKFYLWKIAVLTLKLKYYTLFLSSVELSNIILRLIVWQLQRLRSWKIFPSLYPFQILSNNWIYSLDTNNTETNYLLLIRNHSAIDDVAVISQPISELFGSYVILTTLYISVYDFLRVYFLQTMETLYLQIAQSVA